MVLVDKQEISLRAYLNGKFVRAVDYGNAELAACADEVSDCEVFIVHTNPDDDGVFLEAKINNKFVCAENAGFSPLIANRYEPSTLWEKFFIEYLEDDRIVIKSACNGLYVSAQSCTDDGIGEEHPISSLTLLVADAHEHSQSALFDIVQVEKSE